MKYAFTLLALLCALAGYAQTQTCEYSINEFDPYLKIQKTKTSETIVYNWWKRLSLSFANYGGDKYLVANVSLLEPALFANGDKLIILLEGGETVELELLGDNGRLASFGETFTAAGISSHNFTLFYPIESTEILKGKKLAGVRLYKSGDFVEFPAGKTGKELGGAGKAKKLERLNNIFSAETLSCINI